MKVKFVILAVLFTGCTAKWRAPDGFTQKNIKTSYFDIATHQRLTNPDTPIYIYIEGDGYAFDARGKPTHNPTPHGTTMRDIAASAPYENVVYMARPCQFTQDTKCTKSDWTNGRFSVLATDSVADAIKQIARTQPVILIGYSGGAMISGLVIQKHPEINIQKWITVAGVLNHQDWTQYFGDAPLLKSENLEHLPRVPQKHYIAEHDTVVPYELSKKWLQEQEIIIVPNTNHWNIYINE